ncbi:S1C family serine protease [Streptacidiphilus sp. N1-12]|uniref:S1C family serine protease n=2 Tax=Streptacidiphilus alkalitolerans TaxID=3342712 RepID=A0ABV6WF07_9ACTN
MSTEHEGGYAGSQQPAPVDGAAAGPSPYAQERAVPTDAADDTVVQPVSPPVDPTLAGFPPPVVQPQPAAPAPADAGVPAPVPAPVAPAAVAAPAAEGGYENPTVPSAPVSEPAPEPAPAFTSEPAPATAPVSASGSGSAPDFPPAPAQAAYPEHAPAYPADAPAYPQQPPVYGAQQPPHQPPPYGSYAGGDYPPSGEGPYAPYGTTPPRKKRRGGLIALLAATALVAGGIGGGIGAALETHNSSDGSTVVSTTVDPKALSRAPDSIAGIAAKALPSVVTISASNSQESGTGTGFVFDTDGHILTNNHVVAPSDNGGKLSVKFSDGTSYPATIVGRASGYDVAVIKIDGTPKKPLVPLALGNSDAVAVGDTTIAIGAPFGLSGTVTSGIISAKNRPVASGDETGAQTSYMNALQTDASINPGNSGGPLMNSSGQVIGIDSAIQSTGQNSDTGGQSGSIGLGFAIPINQAQWVAQQLIKTGKPTYPIIGVLRDDSYQGTGAKIAAAPVQGTPAITAGGPADKAGLKPGDIITELGGVQIDSGPTLVSEIWSHHPGDVVSVTYTRDGKTHTTSVTLGSRVGDQ